MPNPNSIRDYRALPYSRVVELVTEEDGETYFIARIAEIPWIETDGENREEALLRLDGVFDDAIASLIESDDVVPVPKVWPASVGYTPPAEQPVEVVRRLIPTRRPSPAVEILLPEEVPEFTVVERQELQTV